MRRDPLATGLIHCMVAAMYWLFGRHGGTNVADNMAVQTKFLWLGRAVAFGGSDQWLARVLARRLGRV